MLATLRLKIERLLYARGIASDAVRRILSTQIMIAAAGSTLGVLASPFTLWPLMFGVGAGIALFNLWHIVRFAQGNMHRQFSAALGIKLFTGFSVRLLLTAFVLFLLIVRLRVPVIPLLIGLTSTVAGIALWGGAKFFRKTVKEA